MDRSNWKVSTPAQAIAAVRAALKSVNSPFADVNFEADLLDYVGEEVWLICPHHSAPEEADVSGMVDVRSGAVEIGLYKRGTITTDLHGERD